MDHAEALSFLASNHRCVLATVRADGRPQLSPVVCALDDRGRVVVSTREDSAKARNLRRDPHASLCVFSDAFFGAWVQLEGTAEVVSLPEALEPLVEYYRLVAGEHEDWDAYRSAMALERRVLVRIEVERVGPRSAT